LIGRDVAQLHNEEPRAVRRELFEPGQDIVAEGEVGHRLYVVVSGEAEVLRAENGAATRVATIGPGAHFGELAVFDAARRSATVPPVARVEVLSLGRDAATSLSDALPGVGVELRRGPHEPAVSLPESLRRLPAPHQAVLAGYLEPVEFPAGSRIFAAGDAGDGC